LTFKTPLKTDRMHDNIRGIKLTPASHRCYKIGLRVEGLKRLEYDVRGSWKFFNFSCSWSLGPWCGNYFHMMSKMP